MLELAETGEWLQQGRERQVSYQIAQLLQDLSGMLASQGEREAASPLPHGRGDEFHHGSSGP